MKFCHASWVQFLFAGFILFSSGCEKEPLAGFTAEPVFGPAPLTVQFSDKSTLEKKAAIDGWYWDFGDGNTATEHQPSHVYPKPGIYTVSLTVTTKQGKSNIATLDDYITVLALVPDLSGKTQSDAQSILKEIGLNIGSVSLQDHDTFAAGMIIGQEPETGSMVPAGTSIHVIVSTGPRPVSVPDVTGLSHPEAVSIIRAAGLEVGNLTEQYHPAVPPGLVLSQNPVAGSLVFPGTLVDITLSIGAEPVDVPDVTGMSQEEAAMTLMAAGLNVGLLMKENHETIPAGFVLQQHPEAGTGVFAGTAIDLLISRGPVATGISIGSIEELQRIGNEPDYPLGMNYFLSNDIDASGTAAWNDGAGFKPIGTSRLDEAVLPFTGAFDGQGYLVSGLTINRPGENYAGLFGMIGTGGRVFNLGLANCVVNGYENTGSLAGYNEGHISLCHFTGAVTGNNAYIGGLTGYNRGTLSGCSAMGEVTGSYFYTGGLAGYNTGLLTQCRSSSPVKGNLFTGGLSGWNFGTLSLCRATGRVIGEWYTGGLTGQNWAGTISECYATGSVTGQNSVGGLIGYNGNAAFVTQCYALGAVTSNWIGGGLVGYNGYGSIITECYSAGRVTGIQSAGGLIGENNYGVVSTSFWDVTASGTSISAAGRGLNTEQMQLLNEYTTAGWDLLNVWKFFPGSYPSLRNTP